MTPTPLPALTSANNPNLKSMFYNVKDCEEHGLPFALMGFINEFLCELNKSDADLAEELESAVNATKGKPEDLNHLLKSFLMRLMGASELQEKSQLPEELASLNIEEVFQSAAEHLENHSSSFSEEHVQLINLKPEVGSIFDFEKRVQQEPRWICSCGTHMIFNAQKFMKGVFQRLTEEERRALCQELAAELIHALNQ